MLTYQVNVRLDRTFVKMEKRGLVHLLRGQFKELYLDWMQKPATYRDWIYWIESTEVNIHHEQHRI
jgi:hypothetical protein